MRTALLLCLATVLSALPLSAAEDASSGWIGTVTVCQGEAILQRGDQLFRVGRGAGIRFGDTIETNQGSMVTLTMDNGPVVTLAKQSSLSIGNDRDHWELVTNQGQLRVVHDGLSSLRLTSNESVLSPQRAIVMVRNDREETTFELISGEMAYASARIESTPITTPAAFQVAAGKRPRRITNANWTLSSGKIQMAAATQTTPLFQVPLPDAGDALPLQDQANGGSDSAFADNMLDEEDEDEDELRPPVQEPITAPTRAAADDGLAADDALPAATNTFGGSSSLSLGAFSSASGTFFSGGIFGDANQQTFQGMVVGTGNPFPGAIHLVTGETRFPFTSVQLTNSEFNGLFPVAQNKFFSIGTGPAPTGQVVTNFFTGTGANPNVIDIPRFDAHLIELDQYAIPDPAQGGGLSSNIGLTGLVGPTPTGPTVVGAAPLVDERAQLNSGATFALGEFLVTATGTNDLTFTIRRSDQDRLIVKDAGGNDANDQVTPNTEVVFDDTVDSRFLPQSPTVKTPRPNESLSSNGTGISELNFLRRAAFTTLVADQLQDYSRRTGQTRFVLDGKIIDISGYRP